MRKRLPDWFWLRGGKVRYCCPLAMTLWLYIWRIRGRRFSWYESDGGAAVFEKRAIGATPQLQIGKGPPTWMVVGEGTVRGWISEWRARGLP